jgi:NAD(P)-dependent dehydrogenase (short-subunit alcohol dehydrogenase family)
LPTLTESKGPFGRKIHDVAAIAHKPGDQNGGNLHSMPRAGSAPNMEEIMARRPDPLAPDRRALIAGLAGSAMALSAAQASTGAPAPLSGRANPQGRFSGKVVLITGATSGIGQTTAEAFAREGARVAFCGRREDLGSKVEEAIRASGGEALFIQADVRDPVQVERFVSRTAERWGRLDIAFNNAGVFLPTAELQDLTVEQYRDVIATNLDGVFYAMKYELPLMRRQASGVIINMASVAGHKGFANTPHYNASKHGVVGLTKAAGVANAKHGIRVNSISPLAVDTPMLQASFAHQGLTYEGMAPNFVTPRIMSTDEMAGAVMFLASDEASSINAMDLDVTGGQLA